MKKASCYTLKIAATLTIMVLLSGRQAAVWADQSIQDRVAEREYPSVFQAWNPIDMAEYPQKTIEQRMRAAAKHDLLWEEPVSQLGYGVDLVLGAVWDHRYGGLARGFTAESQNQALKNRQAMLKMNPHMVFLMEVRWRDAPGSFLPEDSPFWKRNPDGSRTAGWAGGPEPYYMLDYENKAFQANISRQAKLCIESGIYDGIMLDWSGYLPIVKQIRQTIGDEGLILVNIHDDIQDGMKYKDFINGSFMELNPFDDVSDYKDRSIKNSNKRSWDTIQKALIYFEKNFQKPRINCLEVWGERGDLARMRAATCLGLTHSNGYVLYADPNPLKTPDHLHDWYDFWDVKLGKPTGNLIKRTDGGYQRNFQKGTVIYNPYKNGSITVRFDELHKRVSSNETGLQFIVADRDGDIFLPIGDR